MSMEGPPPAPPEKVEKEPITDEQCIEAMKGNNFDLVREWYVQQEVIASQDPTIADHLNLTLHMARLQNSAGLRETALQTLEDAYTDAYQQGDDVSAQRIRGIITIMARG